MSESLLAAQFAAAERIALAVEYDGSGFFGWQAQRNMQLPTVQETLETALSKIAAAPIQVVCAGRTDTGVHGSHQIVHFEPTVVREEKAWVLGGNTLLPASITIKWATPVPADFHARFSAIARRYRYVIYNSPRRSAHLPRLSSHIPYALDANLMHSEAQSLLGEGDFTSFRGAGCQAKSATRTVHFIEVKRFGDFIVVDIQANAFLLHMVRNIVGTLLAVGRGRQPPGWTAQVFAACDRKLAAATAHPQGLYLVDVLYPEQFVLPRSLLGPAFINLAMPN
ncbi:MAG: tRNA pseudouridine(38-40) synthase [Verrucomicrobiaceae bacterium]|nr:tRNA pseudouridine(38-40) synthase [Verrucomicrobiaceae bacterium]